MKKADIGIVGGGLAGLTAAIHLASCGLKVLLFEKEAYPHHKVCGEYLSREILPYLESLNISLESLNPTTIDQLFYSTPSGKTIKSDLKLGGIGISRYALDNFLYEKAKEHNVEIIQQMVTTINFAEEAFKIVTSNNQIVSANIVLGAFGKRSILDKKLNRGFIEKKSGWLAVKAHYKHDDYPQNRVSLHNFNGGYCGLSKTETGAVNVCYLATYASFKDYKNTNSFKEEVLCKNPELKNFFDEATPLFETDLSIAQVSFDKKSLVEDHILMLGDAAGLIHPLCGNGMAMALHSAKLASESILKYYGPKAFSRTDIEKEYIEKWNQQFRSRMKIGSLLQKILLKPVLAEASQNIIKTFPSLLPFIITKTHGKPVI
ncbi:MAG: NAD(P)/FAD-dependent oxidoreductase [Bacteroidota bacterium]